MEALRQAAEDAGATIRKTWARPTALPQTLWSPLAHRHAEIMTVREVLAAAAEATEVLLSDSHERSSRPHHVEQVLHCWRERALLTD